MSGCDINDVQRRTRGAHRSVSPARLWVAASALVASAFAVVASFQRDAFAEWLFIAVAAVLLAWLTVLDRRLPHFRLSVSAQGRTSTGRDTAPARQSIGPGGPAAVQGPQATSTTRPGPGLPDTRRVTRGSSTSNTSSRQST